jgi:drug/metabolite transporter (DMT)-like permease
MAISIPMIHATSMPDATTIALVAALGLASSMLGFLLWNYAGACVPAERMGLMLYLIPVVCMLAGTGFLGETLTAPIICGGALTVFGVWVASINRRHESTSHQSLRSRSAMYPYRE